MERTKYEYKYFIVKISIKNSQLTGKLVFLANSFGEPTVSVIRRCLTEKNTLRCVEGTMTERQAMKLSGQLDEVRSKALDMGFTAEKVCSYFPNML